MKLMNVLAGALLFALSTMTASASTVSGVFAPDPVFSGVLLATGDDVSVPAGTTRTFTTSLFPIQAEFVIELIRQDGLGMVTSAYSELLQPGEVDSFTPSPDPLDLFYLLSVRVFATDVAALPAEQQLQFFGTQPPTLFDFTGDTGTGGTGGGGGTMSPVPLPAAVWLLLAALGGLVAPALRGRPH